MNTDPAPSLNPLPARRPSLAELTTTYRDCTLLLTLTNLTVQGAMRYRQDVNYLLQVTDARNIYPASSDVFLFQVPANQLPALRLRLAHYAHAYAQPGYTLYVHDASSTPAFQPAEEHKP